MFVNHLAQLPALVYWTFRQCGPVPAGPSGAPGGPSGVKVKVAFESGGKANMSAAAYEMKKHPEGGSVPLCNSLSKQL